MKPYPFSSLNHLTVPVGTNCPFLRVPGRSFVANPHHGTCNVQLRRPAPALTAPRYQGRAAEGSKTGAPHARLLVERRAVGGRRIVGLALAACIGALLAPVGAQARMPAPRIK